ncbi:MAG: tetratricopeptide repeat protein [Bacteroidota bacterium]
MDHHAEWEKIESIVDRALELESEKRIEFIKKQCDDNNRIFQKVLELIEAIESSDGYLEETMHEHLSLINEWTKISDHKESSFIGQTIHQYKITRLVEHGGMGSVFEAHRVGEAFEQKVALKIIRRGMDTPANIARFNREQQILANLHHPNIAQLYDGGVTEDGLPYLIMEYVEGTPIDEYCNKQKLTVDERIELFKQVCKAIKHAHKNLIIHRDLKPSNILVTEEGHVKILDFGISKILENDVDALYQTREHIRPVSLGYAAPEQLQNKSVTTSVDTYGLGILLYQLLIELHPFDFEERSISEMEQIILNVTAPSPIKRFRNINSKSQKEAIAENRSTTPEKLISGIKGDLEAIILKLLLKDSNRRYGSTEELLNDLDRYQNDLPVKAQHNNIRYRATKFVKRHRKGLATAAAFLMILLGLSTYFTTKITIERNQAELEAEKSERISEFLIDIFKNNDPANAQGDTISVNEVLTRAEEKINQLDEQPEVKSSMMFNIGRVYYNLGKHKKASKFLNEAHHIHQKNSESKTTEQADILRYLGLIDFHAYDYENADSKLTQSLNIYEDLEKTQSINYFKILDHVAALTNRMGNVDSAKTLYHKAMELHSKLSNKEKKELTYGYSNFAVLQNYTGEINSARSMMEKALEKRLENYGTIHPKTLNSMQSLGNIHRKLQNYEYSKELLTQSVEISKQLYGSNSTQTAEAYNLLGLTYKENNQYKKAENYYKKALKLYQKQVDKNHPKIAVVYNNLGTLHSSKDNNKQALDYHQKSLSIRKQQLGEEHPKLAKNYDNIGYLYKHENQIDSAKVNFKKALKIRNNYYEGSDPDIGYSLYNVGTVYGLEKKWDKTEKYLIEALDMQKKYLDKMHPDLLKTYFAMAVLMEKTSRYKRAKLFYKKVLKIREDVPASDFTRYENTAEKLADVLKKNNEDTKADSLLATIK